MNQTSYKSFFLLSLTHNIFFKLEIIISYLILNTNIIKYFLLMIDIEKKPRK